jgi:hypothetical protein
MKNATARGQPGVASSKSSDIDRNRNLNTAIVSAPAAPNQDPHRQSGADSALHIGAIWKSPRDKRQCIEAKIKSYQGSPAFLDLRILEMDAAGRMQPTHRGITCSMARLPALAKLVGDAVRKAGAAGLLTAVST